MGFYDATNFLRKLPSKHCIKEELYIAVNLKLTWQHLLSEFRSKQTKAVRVNQVHLSLNQVHVSLWASMAASMITSFTQH